jgi:non-heme chloroperoxidase
MSTFKKKDATEIYYKDWGKGQPFVLSHGWPLSADAWNAKMTLPGRNGYRAIAHYRRGHWSKPGKSAVSGGQLVGKTR